MAGPVQKKPKTSDDSFFYDFKKRNPSKLLNLASACRAIEFGHDRMNLVLVKIEEANATCNESFSNASCRTSLFDDDSGDDSGGFPVVYSVGSVFADGIETLRQYLKDDMRLPYNNSTRKALRKLLAFISTSLTSLENPQKQDMTTQKEETKTQKDFECKWAVQLTQHLLSKLAVGCNYTMENQYSKQKLQKCGDKFVCPCGKKDVLDGDFGDTSFGCPGAWHGSVDIMLEKNLPVSVTSGEDENQPRDRLPSDSSDNGNESSVEEMNGGEFKDRQKNQLLAQSIVFSFLQRKHYKKSLRTMLIPSIGINSDGIIVHLYDSENDILFRSATLKLFVVDNTLDVKTVVFLWLVLNYKCFCSGIKEEMKAYRANFFDHVGDYLPKYVNEVTRPLAKTMQSGADAEYWADISPRFFAGQRNVDTVFYDPKHPE